MVAPLRSQFDEQLVKKRYTAVVIGETPEVWTAKEELQKDPEEPFRSAETQFSRKHRVSIGDDVFSVLDAEPKTGRFHQIRKHLLASGTPIVGDFLYGDIDLMTRIADQIEQPRLMLHAGQLEFSHPESGKQILVKSILPDRFSPFITSTPIHD